MAVSWSSVETRAYPMFMGKRVAKPVFSVACETPVLRHSFETGGEPLAAVSRRLLENGGYCDAFERMGAPRGRL